MLDPYAFEELHRMEQRLRDDRHRLLATWREREPRRPAMSLLGGTRRWLARALLLLADRLDPRTVVSLPHAPGSPALNGTLHHA